MAEPTFKALVVRETEGGRFERAIESRRVSELPDGEVLVRVVYSSLNYKDALSATGHKGVSRNFPHTPGIDAAGIVAASSDERFGEGDEVIVTSYDLGMGTAGGFGQYVRVPADWVLPRPDGLSLRESMILGTAGFTAALGLHKLQEGGVMPGAGEVLVTGSTGGVGSLAVAIFSRAGHRVVAATGKNDAHDWLRALGASEVVGRDAVDDHSDRPLLKSRWSAVMDTVGGNVLATALRSTVYGGGVACCGLVASPELNTSVYPFILRGVTLYGVDSAQCPMPLRGRLWQQLAGDWKPGGLENVARECDLDGVSVEIDTILAGRQRGRVLVNVQG
jgi:putative YhdH/YhfP family quinone oxidoreductase